MTQHIGKMAGKAGLALLLTLTAGFPATAGDYVIDTRGMHAFIQFRIIHLGYSFIVGRFNDFEGEFSWDRDNPEASSINVEINSASVDTNHAERDKHLREADFLHVKKYPTATFKSTRYMGDEKAGRVEGILTLRGVSRPVTLEVRAIGEGPDPWGGYRAGFEATTSIRLADFGITYDLGPMAKTMDFELHIEGVRQ